jgi:hypothetical protein
VLKFGSKSSLKKCDGIHLEPKERNTTVAKLTARLGLIEADTKVFDIIGSNEQLAAGNCDFVGFFVVRRF